ncbi:MAG: ATP-binding protein [Undibacterium sp.]|nr:ATP-binding protein [Undibacterium sp.]
MMQSLRVRLILLFGIAIVAADALQFATSFQAAMAEANKLSDYHMQQMALALQDSNFEQIEQRALPGMERSNFDFVVQVWGEDGARVYQSRSHRALPERAVLGYSTVVLDNGDWRIYAARANKRVLQVAQKIDIRRDRAISLAVSALWPVIPVSLLLFAAAWWVVSAALAPLNRIGRELANRNADSIVPVSDQGVPQEVSLLVTELNSLLARTAQAMRSQRQFVADAAHELRSPITALKLQVQTLARSRDDAALVQGVTRLQGGVDRASHLVEQLLALARQEPSSINVEPTLISLSACVDLAISDVAPLALSKNIQLKNTAQAAAMITGNAESLRVMIRNLLDNAIRYIPENGQVQIDLVAGKTSVELLIQDSGEGIPLQDRARIFDRFYRVPGTNTSGSGLGLAIAKTIADRHKARIDLADAALGGLAVKISFPV